MKKLTLRLEDLRIDSFATNEAEKKSGTVFGEECTCHTNCTCPGCPTCDATCATCDVSCNGTCGATCDFTCYATCAGCYGPTEPGFATEPGPMQFCVLC